MDITSKQRKALSKKAHHLDPVVMVGQQGLTEGVVKAVDKALEDHELIKVRFIDFKEGRREISSEMAEKTGSLLVRVIGNVAILYRENDDKENEEK